MNIIFVNCFNKRKYESVLYSLSVRWSSVTYPEIWRSSYGDAASPCRDTASPEGDAASS
jgi:hypothetical protein